VADSSRLGQEFERGTSGAEADTCNRPVGADTNTPEVAVDNRLPGLEQQDTA